MKHVTSIGYRRPRESGGPEQPFEPCGPWVPAFAGMTDKTVDFAEIIVVRALNDLHPQNQGKAKFFMLFGFMLTNWQELRKALLDHPHNIRLLIKRHSDTAKSMRLVVRLHRLMAEILVCDHSGLSNRPAQTRNSSPHTLPLLKAAEGREPDHFSSGEHVNSLH